MKLMKRRRRQYLVNNLLALEGLFVHLVEAQSLRILLILPHIICLQTTRIAIIKIRLKGWINRILSKLTALLELRQILKKVSVLSFCLILDYSPSPSPRKKLDRSAITADEYEKLLKRSKDLFGLSKVIIVSYIQFKGKNRLSRGSIEQWQDLITQKVAPKNNIS